MTTVDCSSKNVQIKVRLQARGGKFLGPNVATPSLLVRRPGDTTPLFTGTFDNGASGTVVATPTTGASRNTIVVQPPPQAEFYPAAGAYALEPPGNEAMIVACFDLTEPSPVEFIATAYTKNPAVALSASATMQLCPGTILLNDPGLLLTVPGLIVGDVSASYTAGVLTVSATVTMMCGCPITAQPWTTPPDTEPYWPSYEFEVTASIPGLAPLPLQCTATNTFSASISATIAKGTYQVTVAAVQPAETNAGYASTQLTV